MEALNLIEPYWRQLKGLVIYVQLCVGSDMHAPVCRNFWMSSVIVAFAIAILLFIFIAKRVIKEQLEFHRNRKRLEARAIVADPDTMEEYKWVGDDIADVDLSHAELTSEIRNAVKSGHPSASGRA